MADQRGQSIHILSKSECESAQRLASKLVDSKAPLARVGFNVVNFSPTIDETNSVQAHLRLGVSKASKNPIAGVQVVVSW